MFGNVKFDEKLLHFDYPGMYQRIMEDNLPGGKLVYEEYSGTDLSVPGFYLVKLNYRTYLPVLPLKEDKLLFKEGIIQGLYWHEEILLALEVADEVLEFKVFHRFYAVEYGPFLKEFAAKLGRLREDGGMYDKVGKLIANAFYGRLGLRGDFEVASLIDSVKNNNRVFATIAPNLTLSLEKKKIHKALKTNVAVAAAITSKARIKLYRGFQAVISNGGRIIYCDTDSIFAAFPINSSVENKYLGDIIFDTTVPGTIIADSVFIAPKTYGLRLGSGEEVIKIKGVTRPEVSLHDLKTCFKNKSDVLFETERILKTNLSLSMHFEKKIIKTGSYEKRI